MTTAHSVDQDDLPILTEIVDPSATRELPILTEVIAPEAITPDSTSDIETIAIEPEPPLETLPDTAETLLPTPLKQAAVSNTQEEKDWLHEIYANSAAQRDSAPVPAHEHISPPRSLSAEERKQLLYHLENHLESAFAAKLNSQLVELQKLAVDLAISELKADLPRLLREALDQLPDAD